MTALLGESGASQGFPPDDRRLGFPYATEMSPLLVGYLSSAAQTTASRAVARLEKLLPCDPGAAVQDACIATFLKTFLGRAFRRPPTAEELAAYQRLFTSARLTGDLRSSVQTLLEAILQSPKFLYLIEKGDPVPGQAGVRRLGPYEVASRLSFALWDSMPDDALLSAARDGRTGTAEGIQEQVGRLMADPRARQGAGRFFEHWLELEELQTVPKDAKIYPSFTAQIRQAMVNETIAFGSHVLFDLQGHLATLLTAPYTFFDASLARFHGVTAAPGGTTPQKSAADATRRAGILTQGSFLSVNAAPDEGSPTLRGKFVREQLLCQGLPPPPDDVITNDGAPGSGMGTKRQRISRHASDPMCSGCHGLIDPIGFAFEHFDGVGRFRTSDSGAAIDARGELIAAGDANGVFDGATALAARLAESSQVRDCYLQQWFRFLFRRAAAAGDTASLEAARSAFASSGYKAIPLILALARSDAFLFRAEGTTP